MNRLLSTNEAARLIGIERKTAENWRCRGFGPRFIRVGRLIKYDPADIETWKSTRRVSSTSQPVAA